MGTQITFRRGSSFPTAGSGITLSEPVFETTLHTFHIGLGHGITAEWVGAPISGLSADIGAGITYKIPTAASVRNYISGLCYGNTGAITITQYVSSFNGSTGAVQGVSSFNGLTGAVTGASLGANTFTGLNTFNAGLCASGITLTGSIRFTGSDTKEIVSRTATLTIRGVTSNPIVVVDNAIVLPTDNTGMGIRSTTGIVDFSTNNFGASPVSTGLRLNCSDGELIYGSVNIWAESGSISAGRTLSVPDASGTIALTSQLMGAVNGSTAATTAVTSFNGRTGAVQGVSSAAAGTGISVSAATGAITITNIGVQSFNGNTGAVTGASLGANTFTGLNTFNAGVTTSFLYASTGSTFGSTLQVNGGATFAGRVDVVGILDVVGGTTFESTTDHAGVARFASGVTISGTLNGATATFSRLVSSTVGVSAPDITTQNVIRYGNNQFLSMSASSSSLGGTGSTVRVNASGQGVELRGWNGATRLGAYNDSLSSYITYLSFSTNDLINEIGGSVTITPVSYNSTDTTLYMPNDTNGTLALTSQLMGAVNGSTAATTAVTSFNGRTGAVQGVSSAAAGTGISVSAATGAVTITNTGVQSFNGNTGAVTGASLGANTFTGLNTFNAGISAAGSTFSTTIRVEGTATFAGLINSTAGLSGTGITLSGNLSAATKSFVIPHPTQPHMTLQHGSLEGPENGVYVRGRLTGTDTIPIPHYWSGLVDSSTITVTLTEIGNRNHHWVAAVDGYTVTVASEGGGIDCFYTVWGERKDVGKLPVEY